MSGADFGADDSTIRLPRGWSLVPLGELLHTIEAGKSFSCEPRPARPDEWGVIKVSAMTWGKFDEDENKAVPASKQFDPAKEIREGDILLSRSNTAELVGASVLVGACRRRLLLSDKSMRLDYVRAIAPQWLQGALASPDARHQLSQLATGTSDSMRNVSQEKVSAVVLRLPPALEQERIVDAVDELLSDLDAGIAALMRVRQKLAYYRATVLKAAVEGALTAEWRAQHPATELGSALLSRILAERRRRWEEEQLRKFAAAGKEPPKAWKAKYKEPVTPDTTGLPPLPDRWCWATVDQLVAHEANAITDGPFGSNLKTEHYTAGGPRVIRLQNIRDGVFADEKAHISEDRFSRLQKHRVEAGDIVIAGLGESPPRACVIPDFVGPAIVKADCIRFKPQVSLSARCVSFFLNSAPTRARMKTIVHGIGRPRLNLGEIKSIVVPVPSTDEQGEIVEAVEDQLSVIDHIEADLETKLKTAQALRQSILRRAFTGQLVPQDPNDEPASELLKRIAAEREERARQALAAKRTGSASKTSRPRPSRTPRYGAQKRAPTRGERDGR